MSEGDYSHRAAACQAKTTFHGRYAPEFDALGNDPPDHPALRELARRTGGQVIDARQTHPLEADKGDVNLFSDEEA